MQWYFCHVCFYNQIEKRAKFIHFKLENFILKIRIALLTVLKISLYKLFSLQTLTAVFSDIFLFLGSVINILWKPKLSLSQIFHLRKNSYIDQRTTQQLKFDEMKLFVKIFFTWKLSKSIKLLESILTCICSSMWISRSLKGL